MHNQRLHIQIPLESLPTQKWAYVGLATEPSRLASRHRQALRHIDTSIYLPLSSSFRPLGHINGGVKLQQCSVLAGRGLLHPGAYSVLTTILAIPICLVDYPGRHLQSKSSNYLPLSSSFRPLGHRNVRVKLQQCSVLAGRGLLHPGAYSVLTTILAIPICLADYPGRHLQSKSSNMTFPFPPVSALSATETSGSSFNSVVYLLAEGFYTQGLTAFWPPYQLFPFVSRITQAGTFSQSPVMTFPFPPASALSATETSGSSFNSVVYLLAEGF